MYSSNSNDSNKQQATMVQTKPEAPGATTPQRKIELFSTSYFAACTLGGIIGKYTLYKDPLFKKPIH